MPDEHGRALRLDGGLENFLSLIKLPSSRDTMAQLRTYLSNQNVELGNKNIVQKILKKEMNGEIMQILLGPTIDKGPHDSHFCFESGSRLSFSISLREQGGHCSLLAYRFQINFPESSQLPFYRFDLNRDAHETPLFEPRCHYHPGLNDVRLPCPPLAPLDVLDRIFLVVEPAYRASTR